MKYFCRFWAWFRVAFKKNFKFRVGLHVDENTFIVFRFCGDSLEYICQFCPGFGLVLKG